MKKRNLALILALVMLLTACVAGTLAWLTDKTQSVENVFTVGNIDITLTETDADKDGDANPNSYKMVPGNVIAKDPIVTVKGGSEDCWMFIKVVESENLGEFISYKIDPNNWKKMADKEGIYYAYFKDIKADRSSKILLNNQVTVNSTVTKEMMDDLSAEGATLPQLTFTAWAVQMANLTLEQAWAEADKLLNPPTTP